MKIRKIQQYQFLFEELVKRDFKKKYKRSVLGAGWSLLSPLLMLLVMYAVFKGFFGRDMEHYITYLFCGNLIFSYFRESSQGGMNALTSNGKIISKIKVPKHIFLLAKNVQTFINFLLSLLVFAAFCIIDRIPFSWKLILLVYPIALLVAFNIGIGLILSALFVFFRDIAYLWQVFLRALTYLSAIYYSIDRFSPFVQRCFYLNPVYLFIRYFRIVIIETSVPPLWLHGLILADTVLALFIGVAFYRFNNNKFLYYL